MKPTLAALLIIIALAFAALDLQFLALITVIILVMFAATDMATPTEARSAPAGTGAAAAAGEDGVGAKLKKTTITKSGDTKTKIVDYVDKDETKWAPPGKPKNWGKMPNEEFGSGLAMVVTAPVKLAASAWNWISSK